jgi:hypothetical protein
MSGLARTGHAENRFDLKYAFGMGDPLGGSGWRIGRASARSPSAISPARFVPTICRLTTSAAAVLVSFDAFTIEAVPQVSAGMGCTGIRTAREVRTTAPVPLSIFADV